MSTEENLTNSSKSIKSDPFAYLLEKANETVSNLPPETPNFMRKYKKKDSKKKPSNLMNRSSMNSEYLVNLNCEISLRNIEIARRNAANKLKLSQNNINPNWTNNSNENYLRKEIKRSSKNQIEMGEKNSNENLRRSLEFISKKLKKLEQNNSYLKQLFLDSQKQFQDGVNEIYTVTNFLQQQIKHFEGCKCHDDIDETDNIENK